MAAGKINLQANDGKVLGLYAPDGMSANTDIVPANINGDTTKTFKVSDAINADEAVSKAQLDLKATLVEAQAYDLGVGQTWQDMTASRSANTTYTNTDGKPFMLAVQIDKVEPGPIHVTIDGNILITNRGYAASGGGGSSSVQVVIPNGSTYSVNDFTQWFELR